MACGAWGFETPDSRKVSASTHMYNAQGSKNSGFLSVLLWALAWLKTLRSHQLPFKISKWTPEGLRYAETAYQRTERPRPLNLNQEGMGIRPNVCDQSAAAGLCRPLMERALAPK